MRASNSTGVIHRADGPAERRCERGRQPTDVAAAKCGEVEYRAGSSLLIQATAIEYFEQEANQIKLSMEALLELLSTADCPDVVEQRWLRSARRRLDPDLPLRCNESVRAIALLSFGAWSPNASPDLTEQSRSRQSAWIGEFGWLPVDDHAIYPNGLTVI